MYIHIYIHTHIHTYIHAYTHTCTHTHTHTHTYTHTYIHIRTVMWQRIRASSESDLNTYNDCTESHTHDTIIPVHPTQVSHQIH